MALAGVQLTLLVFQKKYPDKIKGIVLASGVYTNFSKKAEFYSIERIISSKINVNTIVAHHKKDACKVTKFKQARIFYDELQAPRKDILVFDEGVPTGRDCGPLHHHGYENIEENSARKIIEWMVSNAVR